MRIASYYPDISIVGRNDGGPLYHTYQLSKIFGKENVHHIFPYGNKYDASQFDLHYWVDWGEDSFGWTDFVCPKPNVYICSDTHLGFDYRLKKAREFDWVFCNQRKAVDDFIKNGIRPDRIFWLPHAFDPLAYSPGVFNVQKNDWDRDVVVRKKYDVCFVGNLNDENRVDHLDILFKKFPNFYWGFERFHEAAEKFNQSKIVFNISARKDLNMRMFEALGSKGFLLSDSIPESEDVFIPGKHYESYKDKDEMIEKAEHYLKNDQERESIAEAGYREAIEKNTYRHRVETVLKTIGVDFDDKGSDLSDVSSEKLVEAV